MIKEPASAASCQEPVPLPITREETELADGIGMIMSTIRDGHCSGGRLGGRPIGGQRTAETHERLVLAMMERIHIVESMRKGGQIVGGERFFIFSDKEVDRLVLHVGAQSLTICDVGGCERIGKVETCMGRLCCGEAHGGPSRKAMHLIAGGLYKLLNLGVETPGEVELNEGSWKDVKGKLELLGQFDVTVYGVGMGLRKVDNGIQYRLSAAEEWKPICHAKWCLREASGADERKCKAHKR